MIYFLLDFKPSLSISNLIAFLISKKINKNSVNSKNILKTNKYCKLLDVNFMKLLSIKVKNVKKPIDKVIINRNIK